MVSAKRPACCGDDVVDRLLAQPPLLGLLCAGATRPSPGGRSRARRGFPLALRRLLTEGERQPDLRRLSDRPFPRDRRRTGQA